MPGSGLSCLPLCSLVSWALLPQACFLAFSFSGFGVSGSASTDAASLLDGLFRALGGADALERNGLLDLARQHDLRAIRKCRDDVGLLQGVEIDRPCLRPWRARRAALRPFPSSSGSRLSASGAGWASGRLRSRPCGSRPCGRADPSRHGRRSCPGRRKRRVRRAGASCGRRGRVSCRSNAWSCAYSATFSRCLAA